MSRCETPLLLLIGDFIATFSHLANCDSRFQSQILHIRLLEFASDTKVDSTVLSKIKRSMDSLPPELISYLGLFLDQNSLGSLVCAAKRYHLLLTAQLYENVMEYIDPDSWFGVQRTADGLLPPPWFDLKDGAIQCAQHWKSQLIIDYFSKTSLDILMSPDDWGLTLLHRFSRVGNVKLVQAILERGVDVDTRTRELSTPLHCALERGGGGGIHIVQCLVNAGADVLAQDNRLRSVMCFAASSAPCDVVCLIIDAIKASRGDIFVPDREGCPPLQYAAEHGNVPSLKVLLENGANVMKKNESGVIALASAAWSGCVEACQLLIDSMRLVNGDISTPNHTGKTALHYAIERQNAEVAELLIRYGSNVVAQDGDGKTPLDLAIQNKMEPVLQMLLDVGPDVFPSKDLQHELWRAAKSLDAISMEMLMDLVRATRVTLDLDLPDDRGATLLHHVCLSWHQSPQAGFRIVQTLVRAGANVDLQGTARRDTPLHNLLYFSSRGPKPKSFHETVRILLKASVNLDAQNLQGDTTLHYAAARGDIETVQMLLDKICDEGRWLKNDKGYTALHWAVGELNSEPVIRLLLSTGLNVNAQTKDGQTALHLAAGAAFDLPTLKLLVQAGADVSVLCMAGNPAVHYAAAAGWDEAVGFFVDAGAGRHDGCSVCELRTAPWQLEGERRQKAFEELREKDGEDNWDSLASFL